MFHEARTIAFDNDGTLYPAGVQVAAAVLDAHAQYVRDHGLALPTPDLDWVRRQMGADALDFYGTMLPGEPEEVRADFEAFCLEYEREAVARFNSLYEHIEGLLHSLVAAGRTLVLVSNGTPSYVECVWEHLRYERWFTASYPFLVHEPSHKGERLAQALARYGGPAVMVGDRRSDKDAARHAGAAFIGCAYGYGAPEEIEGADAVAATPDALFGLLLSCPV